MDSRNVPSPPDTRKSKSSLWDGIGDARLLDPDDDDRFLAACERGAVASDDEARQVMAELHPAPPDRQGHRSGKLTAAHRRVRQRSVRRHRHRPRMTRASSASDDPPGPGADERAGAIRRAISAALAEPGVDQPIPTHPGISVRVVAVDHPSVGPGKSFLMVDGRALSREAMTARAKAISETLVHVAPACALALRLSIPPGCWWGLVSPDGAVIAALIFRDLRAGVAS